MSSEDATRDTERPEPAITMPPPPVTGERPAPFPPLPQTMPPPELYVSPETEAILKSVHDLKCLVTLLGNTVLDMGQRLERIEADGKETRRQVEGAGEASKSAIDIATEAKRTLRAICENAESEAAISMDVATQVAEQFGVRDIVDRVMEKHAESRAQRTRASIGPAR